MLKFILYKNDDEIDTCAIQYISERGNLDGEFQMGQKLNYSIIHNNNNNMRTISDTIYTTVNGIQLQHFGLQVLYM